MKNILFFGVWLKIGFLRRGPFPKAFGTSSMSGWQLWGWLLWNGGLGTYAGVPPLSGWQFWVGGWFGMGDLFLTQGVLLCWDDKVWVGGGLTNLATTHHYFVLPRYEESLCFGVILMKNILFFGVWLKIGFLRRGPFFVGMTILGGWLLWNGGLGTYAGGAPLLGWQLWVGLNLAI